jgi:hypothetical protein
MRIYEILFQNDISAQVDHPDPYLDFPPGPFDNDLTNLATAFTKNGMVKRFWDVDKLVHQPSGPGAADDAETGLMPTDTLGPTMVSVQAEPVEQEPSLHKHRLVPFRR